MGGEVNSKVEPKSHKEMAEEYLELAMKLSNRNKSLEHSIKDHEQLHAVNDRIIYRLENKMYRYQKIMTALGFIALLNAFYILSTII